MILYNFPLCSSISNITPRSFFFYFIFKSSVISANQITLRRKRAWQRWRERGAWACVGAKGSWNKSYGNKSARSMVTEYFWNCLFLLKLFIIVIAIYLSGETMASTAVSFSYQIDLLPTHLWKMCDIFRVKSPQPSLTISETDKYDAFERERERKCKKRPRTNYLLHDVTKSVLNSRWSYTAIRCYSLFIIYTT